MSDNRRFHYALLASLVLHALALFALPGVVDTARRAASIPPQIIARLMEPAPPSAPPAPAVEKPVPEKPASKPKPRLEREPVITAPVPAAPPAPPAPPVADPGPALSEPAPPVAAIESHPAPPARAPQPAQQLEEISRDQYRVQLIDEARRHKRYPPLARENNWQGDVRIAVAVAPNGRAAVSLKASSGYEVLDRQALEMFRQAARAVPVPPALRGKEFALEVKAVYSLED